MKSTIFKVLLCGIAMNLLLASKTTAQYMVNGKEVDTTFNSAMNHIFGTLDATRIPYGLLRDYAMEFRNLENFNGTALVDSNKVDKGVFRQIYTTLATARMTASAYASLPNPGAIDSLWYNARVPGQVTLSGLFYQYSYLSRAGLLSTMVTPITPPAAGAAMPA
jgi:hypothetical protein